MSFSPKARRIAALSAIILSFVTAAFYYALCVDQFASKTNSAAGLLNHADTLAWGNRWVEARPLYAQAAALFQAQNQPWKALYATVSEIPADESVSIPGKILQLTTDLAKPEARDPEVELRILTIRGMLETDYDASQALANWERVGSLALQLHHYELATLAEGEQGIAAFLLAGPASGHCLRGSSRAGLHCPRRN
jgi:hypothetical protein